jgi:hypothetical protein
MKAFAIRRGEEHGELAGKILCQDVRPAFRKGHLLRAEDIPVLIAASWSELHLIEPGPGDVAQREAGEHLARILASAGLQIAPAGHRHVLRAERNGLVKIAAEALLRLNTIPGVAVFTLMNDTVVSAGQTVAEAQITPLMIERRALEEASREKEVVRILDFVPRDVVILKRDDRVLRALTEKLQWFGCTIREIITLPPDAQSIRETIEHAPHPALRATLSPLSRGEGSYDREGSHERDPSPRLRGEGGRRPDEGMLIIVQGSNALDPLDPVFVALDAMGATMQKIGMPVHPGTLLWIASRKNATIIGLPSCGLGPQLTAFDLVLPKLLAEGSIRNEDLAALGHGGILQSRVYVQEAIDEPVR